MKNEKRWYQKVSNWLTIIAVVILVPVLLINLSIMFQANTDKEKVPSVFGYKPFIVLSGSMETDIKKGDLIITKVTNPATLKVDDVIAFRDSAGTVTTHRIIEIVDREGETLFITKGDNNSSQDQSLVELDDVEGIYITRIPGVGAMLDNLAEPTTIIIVILGITVIFAAAFMVSNKKQISQEQLEFLEYKKQKELAKKEEEAEFLEFKKQKEEEAKKKNAKTSSAKASKTKKEDTKSSKKVKEEKDTTDKK